MPFLKKQCSARSLHGRKQAERVFGLGSSVYKNFKVTFSDIKRDFSASLQKNELTKVSAYTVP